MTLPHANDGHGRLVAAFNKEEYDTTARALLKERKFDPEDLNKACRIKGWYRLYSLDEARMTPLCYFIAKGNLPMCQYLIVCCGVDGRTTDRDGCSPLLVAAMYGHLEIFQLLAHDGGAHEDIRKLNCYGESPLSYALLFDYFEVVQWLIRNGALSSSPHDAVDGGDIDDMIMRRDLREASNDNWQGDKRLTVLAWAQTSVAAYANVHAFLRGTIVSASSSSVCRHPKNPYATRSHKRRKVSSSPLVMFKGKSGILELIAHYIAGTSQQLRTLRQLVNLLPAFIADVPFVEEDEGDEDEDEDE